MMCCMPSGIPENASVQLTKLTFILKIFTVVQLGLGILSMFVSIYSGLMMIIGALILYMIACGRNWCTPVFYIVLTMMDMMTSIMLVGNYFAEYGRIEGQYGAILFFTMIKFPFYTLSIYYSFLAYRELKALFLATIYGNISEFSQSGSASRSNSVNNSASRSNEHQPFSGQGYRLN